MHSCFYQGQVRHRRFSPRVHQFAYRLFYVFLDLDELDQVFKRRWFWSSQRPALARFKRSDYLGDAKQPLKQSVIDLVQTETGQAPRGPIRLLTHLRYFGYNFNPVSFYYCYDAQGEQVEAIVAEITNTPWGERHRYVLPQQQLHSDQRGASNVLNKEFHISPFMPMDVAYDWRFRHPREQLFVHMANHVQQEKMFDATLYLKRYPINGLRCVWVLLRFPFMTLQVISGIYWQALRLFLKKTPFYTHPDKQNEQQTKSGNSAEPL